MNAPAPGYPSAHWAALGEAIAKARRARGWDQTDLARRSGNSPNTISNYERGRATRSMRVPGGYLRVAQALGWPSDAPQRILAGEKPDAVVNEPSLFELPSQNAETVSVAGEPQESEPLRAEVGASGTKFAMLNTHDAELVESGHLAQDVFMRQAKRYRKMNGVSAEDLAERIAGLGGRLTLEDILRLEDGTRLLKMAEATVIAMALDTTVQWLIGSGFSDEAPEEMKWPPNDDELQAEAKAVERRMMDAGAQVSAAQAQFVRAREREEQARQQTQMAMLMMDQAMVRQRELERHYQYLLGRIDSLRAAKGEETVIQFFLEEEER
ncbi:helix-turn-helix transcriptional regulator [Streptomyces sp. NPDC005890]|uniref:helix-turn-helix transcriptional regulator n=1 Tax=Streptomyces sp. NPDC005890 TaxID=3154568 RepID=UPI0033CB9550